MVVRYDKYYNGKLYTEMRNYLNNIIMSAVTSYKKNNEMTEPLPPDLNT